MELFAGESRVDECICDELWHKIVTVLQKVYDDIQRNMFMNGMLNLFGSFNLTSGIRMPSN